MPEQQLIVFARAPRAGSVKTRLASSLGVAGAARAYETLVHRLINQLAELSNVELQFAPADARAEVHHWLCPGWTCRPQAAGDLGMRMQAAFETAFRAGSRQVVLIGSDCPYVQAADVREAWTRLAAADVVLGPALDGGYWLIGLSGPAPDLFEKMTWSTDAVLTETMARCAARKRAVYLLRRLRDIDTVEDWQAFVKETDSPS